MFFSSRNVKHQSTYVLILWCTAKVPDRQSLTNVVRDLQGQGGWFESVAFSLHCSTSEPIPSSPIIPPTWPNTKSPALDFQTATYRDKKYQIFGTPPPPAPNSSDAGIIASQEKSSSRGVCNAAAYAVDRTSLASPQPTPSITITSSAATDNDSNLNSKQSVLHPRVAVILGVDRRWHIPLLFCRALSTAPAAWWGLRCGFTFLADLLLPHVTGDDHQPWDVERRFRVTEVFLAVIWCCASAFLSFFFTDCLMSRWLLNYTPQATLVRLLTINAINAYLTALILHLSGGSEDPRLLLPAWIWIASILTTLYHTSQRKINIRKETSASLSVFSIASFISMTCLLLQLHLARTDEPKVPLMSGLRFVWSKFWLLALDLKVDFGVGQGASRKEL